MHAAIIGNGVAGVSAAIRIRQLKLEGGSYKDRYKGADKPLQAFIDSIKHVP